MRVFNQVKLFMNRRCLIRQEIKIMGKKEGFMKIFGHKNRILLVLSSLLSVSTLSLSRISGAETVPIRESPSSKAQNIAAQYKVDPQMVMSLRTDKKLGWGEINHLLAISQKTGQTTDAILALRESGMGWGQI